ncbi:MAG: DUF3343 domain-containing protein [Oscillospiraceae bacterium]
MMEQYLATFHTHLAALRTDRSLRGHGVASQMMPVPRVLSSSCGTCLRYTASHAHLAQMDADVESVYHICANDTYEQLCKND